MAAPDVFRISDDEVMDEIKLSEYISKNDALVSTRYKKLQDAYEGRYEIFNLPKKEKWKPDVRIAVNFAKYITDTMNGFFIGIPIKVSSPDEKVNEYINYLDQYNDQDDNNAELAKIMKIGRAHV